MAQQTAAARGFFTRLCRDFKTARLPVGLFRRTSPPQLVSAGCSGAAALASSSFHHSVTAARAAMADELTTNPVAEEDADAVATKAVVAMPFPEVFCLGRLPTPIHRLMQLIVLANGCGWAIFFAPLAGTASGYGDGHGSALLWVGGLIIAGAFPFLLLPLASLRRAAGQGEGSLIALGAGTKPIDEDALGSLKRARVFQANLALQWTLFGLLSLLAFSGVLIDPNVFAQWYAHAPGGAVVWYSFAAGTHPLTSVTIGVQMIMGWWMSIKWTAALATPDVTAVVASAKQLHPVSDPDEWGARVTRPSLQLHQVFNTISDSFGNGLAGAVLVCWCTSLGVFALVLDPHCESRASTPIDRSCV
jgi:hypothetical protein